MQLTNFLTLIVFLPLFAFSAKSAAVEKCQNLFSAPNTNIFNIDKAIDSFEDSGKFEVSFRQFNADENGNRWGEFRIETEQFNERYRIKQKVLVGALSFSSSITKPTHLHVIMIRIQPGFMKKGASTYLLAKLVKVFPDTKEIEFELALDNERVYRSSAGTPEEKLKATPVFRSLSKFGFSNIIEVAKRPSPLPPPFETAIPVTVGK